MVRSFSSIPLFSMLLLPALAAAPALAVDGVLEINQTCAVETGCFSGDTAGFPVTTSAAGSYRLTSNLVLPDANTDGIVVGASSTTVDLNGFEIIGAACVGATTSVCRPISGGGDGVRVGGLYFGVSVASGTITGMGYRGVSLWRHCKVTNLRVRWNRSIGIFVDEGSTVSNSNAYENYTGIYAAIGSTVSGNTAYLNFGTGIQTFGSTVSGNTARGNGGYGIGVAYGSTVSGNTAYENGSDGIHATHGSTVSGNTAYGNQGDGIETGQACLIQRNTIYANTGYGLRLDIRSAYRENVINYNNSAGGNVQVTGGVDMGANACNGLLTCP